MSRYAMLVFERRTEELIRIPYGDSTRLVDAVGAREAYALEEEELSRQEREFSAVQRRLHDERDAWTRAVPVEWGVTVKRDAGRLTKERVKVDVATVDGIDREFAPGELNEFLKAEALRRFPDASSPTPMLPFDEWLKLRPKGTSQFWGASWIDGGETRDLGLHIDNWPIAGFPAAEVVKELDRAANSGWQLLHVSEAHGIFKGRHASTAAWPECITYLFGRPD